MQELDFDVSLTLRLSACAHSRDETVKSAVGRIIEYPAAVLILVHLVDLGLELCLALEAIFLPQLSDLTEDLLPVWITPIPLDAWMKPVHHGVDLEARSVVDPLRNKDD